MTKYTAKEIGDIVRQTRKALGITQKNLALVANTGLRFISDLEHGKPSCEINKVLNVMHTLGIKIVITPPQVANE